MNGLSKNAAVVNLIDAQLKWPGTRQTRCLLWSTNSHRSISTVKSQYPNDIGSLDLGPDHQLHRL